MKRLLSFIVGLGLCAAITASAQERVDNTLAITLPSVTTNKSFSVPAGYAIRDVFFTNNAANAVTGGIDIGPSTAPTQVVSNGVVGSLVASSFTLANALPQFSALFPTTLIISAGTSWNGANVDFVIDLVRNVIPPNGGTAWLNNYIWSNGQRPCAVAEFTTGRYFDGSNIVPLTSILSGATVNTQGLSLTTANIQLLNKFATCSQTVSATIVTGTTSGSNSSTAGIVSFASGAPDGPLFRSGGVLRGFDGTSLNTANSGDFTNVIQSATDYDSTGRDLCLSLGSPVSDSHIYSSITSTILGSYAGGGTFNGDMQYLAWYPVRATPTILKALCGGPPPYLFPLNGTSGIKIQNGQWIDAGANLQFERTQAWTVVMPVNLQQVLVPSTALLFGNVANAAGPFNGYEGFLSNCVVEVRLMSAAFPGTNYIDVKGSTNVCLSKWSPIIAVSYDGSSTAAGVKIYINGVLESMTVINNNLSASIISGGHFIIANQFNFTTSFELNGSVGWFTMWNVALSPTAIAALNLTLPTSNATVVLQYPMTEQTGTTLTDVSGSGFTANISANTMWLGNGL